MWSVRMRASQTVVGCQSSAVNRKGSQQEIHISGAEGLYQFADIKKVAEDYLLRAMSHPKGRPDKVVITVEKIEERPRMIGCLPFSTLPCRSAEGAQKIVEELLSGAGISRRAIQKALRLLSGRAAMRGGAVMRSLSGLRAEPDRKRGLRVSRLGMEKAAGKRLSERLSKEGIDTVTVKEAIVLASKVASCKGVMAELCVSDDPGYTTGYVASKGLGYVRIPHIKKKGSLSGGRVFFIEEDADLKRVVEYLEKRPVLVTT
jgi:6-carboxyhexanoate--CoA ligase